MGCSVRQAVKTVFAVKVDTNVIEEVQSCKRFEDAAFYTEMLLGFPFHLIR